jgi:hypothetical protein
MPNIAKTCVADNETADTAEPNAKKKVLTQIPFQKERLPSSLIMDSISDLKVAKPCMWVEIAISKGSYFLAILVISHARFCAASRSLSRLRSSSSGLGGGREGNRDSFSLPIASLKPLRANEGPGACSSPLRCFAKRLVSELADFSMLLKRESTKSASFDTAHSPPGDRGQAYASKIKLSKLLSLAAGA